MFKRLILSFLLAFLCIQSCTFAQGVFTDTKSVPWAQEAIDTLYSKNIISGISDTEFAPDKSITREEFVKLIVCAFGIEAQDDEIFYADVTEDAWYEQYIKTASSKKIVSGISDNLFGVGQNITRQDMAVILYRAMQLSPVTSLEIFADDNAIASYAKEAVYTMKELQIISGMGENCFMPLENATRAQAAKMIYTGITVKDNEQIENIPLEEPTIATFYDNKQGALSLTFDDGDINSAIFYNSVLKKHNFTATAFVINRVIEEKGTLSKWQSLVKEGYIDIGSHSETHNVIYDNKDVTEGQLKADISSAYTKLKKWFPDQKILSFASPYGRTSKASTDEMKVNFFANRRAGGGIATSNIINWYAVPCFLYSASTVDEQTMNGWANQAISKKGWAVELMHGCADVADGDTIDKKTFEAHIDYLATKADKLWVASFNDCVAYIKERQEATLAFEDNGESLTITLTDTLPDNKFDMPLTIIVNVPTSWENGVACVQNGKTTTCNTYKKKDKLYANINVVPDSGTVTVTKK